MNDFESHIDDIHDYGAVETSECDNNFIRLKNPRLAPSKFCLFVLYTGKLWEVS